MALEVKQIFCIVCGDFIVTDTTGTYDSVTNPTGYGGPNPAFGDTTPYTIAFTPPNGTTPVYTLDLLENPPVPDENGYYEYTVTAEQLGYQENVISGIWSQLITLGTDTKTIVYQAIGDIKKKIRSCICCAGLKFLPLNAKLEGAIALFGCFKNQESQEVIDELYRDTAECCDCGC